MTGRPTDPRRPEPVDLRPAAAAPASAAQRVYEALRSEIVGFVHPPGAVLSRADLASRFAVSQTPVREALQMLEQDGLIRIFPQSRTLVTKIDVPRLKETHFLRVATEVEIVRQLAQQPATDVTRRARALLKMQAALAGDLDQADLFDQIDRQFHRTFFDAVGVGALQDMLARSLGHLARCQRLDLPSQGKMQTIIRDHSAILDAIEAGDVSEATAAMRRHLSGTISRVGDLQRAYPDYFDGAWA